MSFDSKSADNVRLSVVRDDRDDHDQPPVHVLERRASGDDTQQFAAAVTALLNSQAWGVASARRCLARNACRSGATAGRRFASSSLRS